MSNKRTKLLEWGKHFIETAKQNNIWFSADVDMILGAQRHGGFVPWNERLQVIMTPESYIKLQRLAPTNVIDSNYSKEFKSLKAAFVENRDDWSKDQPFVEIRIVVPTTLKKIKQFKNPFKYALNTIKGQKETLKNAVNELNDAKFEGFYTLEKRFSPSLENWIPNITFKMEEMRFVNLDVPVIKEWKRWVETKYGQDFMKAVIPNVTFVYPAPLKVIREVE